MPILLMRYLAREFIKPYALLSMAFTAIILLVKVVDELKTILAHKPPLLVSVKYFLFQVPENFVLSMPFAALVAVLFCLMRLGRDGEVTAMKAAGVGLPWAVIPLAILGLGVSLASFLINEALVPYANEAVSQIKKNEIEHSGEEGARSRVNVALLGGGGRVYHVDYYDGASQTMKGLHLVEYADGIRPLRRWDARTAAYDEAAGFWTLHYVIFRTFGQDGMEATAQALDVLPMPELTEKPKDFLREERDPRQLSFLRLLEYIRRLQDSGAEVTEELVELDLKISFPLANVIMVLIGTSFGWAMGRQGSLALAFGLGIVIGLLFLGFVQFGHALGSNGKLSPWLAAWIGNIAFLGLAGYLLRRTPT